MTVYVSGNVAGDGDPYVHALQSRTVYHAASANTPRNRLGRAARLNLSLITNSSSLMATTLINSALGFGYWWVAARAFPASAVGTASAAISALTLIGTLSMFGMGTLLISELPHMKGVRQWRFISTCVAVAGTVAVVGGLIYVVIAKFIITGLGESVATPIATVLLLVGIVSTAMTQVLDDGLVGLLSGSLQLLRNAFFAVLKLAGLIVFALLPFASGSSAILATWVVSGIVSVGLLWLRLKARKVEMSYRPQLSMLKGLVRHAFDHNLLNLALFLPRTTLPLVVTAVLTSSAAGAFYTAYMLVSFLVMIPANLATTLFAVAKGDRAGLQSKIRMALLISAGIGIPGALVLAALAHFIMLIFGHSYADTGGTALAVMALSFPAMIFRPLYVAISRVVGRVRNASAFALVFGAVELGAAWYGGSRGSLTSLAVGLSVAFVLEGLVAAPTVLRVAFGKVHAPAAQADPQPGGEAPPAEKKRIVPRIDLSDVTMFLPRMTDAAVAADELPTLPRQPGAGQAADATTVLPKFTDPAPAGGTDATALIPRTRAEPPDATTVLPKFTDAAPEVPADVTTVLSRTRLDALLDGPDATMLLPRQRSAPAASGEPKRRRARHARHSDDGDEE
jgi:O-antigen/teichoic acid export membrane protein